MSSKKRILKSAEIKEANDKDRTVTAVISREVVDRDGDIVRVKGINAKYWKENPIILADHTYSIDKVVGKGVGKKFWVDGDTAYIKFQLATEEENPLAERIFRLYKGGYVKTMSIGFMPDYDSIEYPEKDKQGARRIFNKSEMLEASIVTVPSNRAAYMKGLEDAWNEGLLDGEELNEMKDLAPEEKEFETTIVENIKAKDDLTTKVKDLAKILQEKMELENKVAELELMLKEQEMDEEIEDDVYTELFGEGWQETGSETDANSSQTDDMSLDDALTILTEE